LVLARHSLGSLKLVIVAGLIGTMEGPDRRRQQARAPHRHTTERIVAPFEYTSVIVPELARCPV
jgi:hypothetical protein